MVLQDIDMNIKLKSSVNWCSHELRELIPLIPKEGEKVFKCVTDWDFNLDFNENKLPCSILFHCGPLLTVGQIDYQTNMELKEICSTFDSNGEYIYTSLVFKNEN